ncbi:hypothetical protein [Streptomyces griseus]
MAQATASRRLASERQETGRVETRRVAAKDAGARDFTARAARLRNVFDRLETSWAAVLPPGSAAPGAFTRACLDEARAEARALLKEFGADPAHALDSRWGPAAG